VSISEVNALALEGIIKAKEPKVKKLMIVV
jgi:hypothetical protein